MLLNIKQPTIATLHTDGKGLYTRTAKAVRIERFRIVYLNDDRDFGELRVYFNTQDWDTKKLSDIYTDKLFKKELQQWLTSEGYAGDDVSYSEHGMQGNDYVSCDVGKKFVASYMQQHKNFVVADF
jgi:hypothetical protein